MLHTARVHITVNTMAAVRQRVKSILLDDLPCLSDRHAIMPSDLAHRSESWLPLSVQYKTRLSGTESHGYYYGVDPIHKLASLSDVD